MLLLQAEKERAENLEEIEDEDGNGFMAFVAANLIGLLHRAGRCIAYGIYSVPPSPY